VNGSDRCAWRKGQGWNPVCNKDIRRSGRTQQARIVAGLLFQFRAIIDPFS
jgi:hypothetical protein